MSPSTQDLLGSKGDLSRTVPYDNCIWPKAVGDERPIRSEASDAAGSRRSHTSKHSIQEVKLEV